MRLRSGLRLTLRPIEIEDLKQAQTVFDSLSEQTRYFRYHRAVPALTPELIIESITSRTEPSVILVATVRSDEVDRIVAGARIESAEPDAAGAVATRPAAEFALAVVDAWQAKGIGAVLLRSLCRRALAMGYRELVGDVLAVNSPMLSLVARLGFTVPDQVDRGEVVRVRRRVAP